MSHRDTAWSGHTERLIRGMGTADHGPCPWVGLSGRGTALKSSLEDLPRDGNEKKLGSGRSLQTRGGGRRRPGPLSQTPVPEEGSQ